MKDYERALGRNLRKFKVFTTIRNPYDKLVSAYFSPHRGNNKWDPDDFARYIRKLRPLQSYLTVDRMFGFQKRLRVDDFTFLRFEHLAQDFNAMCESLSIHDVKLSHRNKALSRRDYRDCYTKELAQWVAKRHNLEIRLGGYRFEDPC